MWSGGPWDFVVLGAGYVLALALSRYLGRSGGAGEAFRRWGAAEAAKRVKGSPADYVERIRGSTPA